MNYDVSIMILHDWADNSNSNYDIDDLLYNVNAVQQDDSACDNVWYYLNDIDYDPVGNQDNANSIQDIVSTIL